MGRDTSLQDGRPDLSPRPGRLVGELIIHFPYGEAEVRLVVWMYWYRQVSIL